MRSKVVAIIGGSGYLGSRLAQALAETNQVVIVDRVRPRLADNSCAVFKECDITDPASCSAAVAGADIVFHRAGLYGNIPSLQRAADYYKVNLLATVNILEACIANRVERLVFDSTAFVFGTDVVSPVSENAAARPRSIYGATKLASEELIRCYDRHKGLSTVTLRFCRVRDSTKEDVITILARRILLGEEIELYDDGAPTLDFVDLDDAISATILATSSGIRETAFNISSGTMISLDELVRLIEEVSGRRARAVRFAHPTSTPPSSEHLFGPMRFCLDISLARSRLGWHPSKTVNQMVVETVERMIADRS